MSCLSNVTIVSNDIDPDVFRPTGHPPAGSPTITAVTRFERRRDEKMLTEIVKSMCQAKKSALWILVGGSFLRRYANLRSILVPPIAFQWQNQSNMIASLKL
jgi:hypothetical protein